VTAGPDVSSSYPLGKYIEDFECVVSASTNLDIYNGVFGKTPEYPDGIYHYHVAIVSGGVLY